MSPDAKPPIASQPEFWRSVRGRQLLWLGGATCLVLVATFLAMSREASTTAARFSPAHVFSGFDDKASAAAEVTIVDKDHKTHVRLTPGGVWTVVEVHGYPASAERMRELFLGLADLKKIARKTEREDLQSALGLVPPEKGGPATLITVTGKDAKPLARLMVGNFQPSSSTGEERAFIRADDAPEAYLAQGHLPTDAAPTEWLDQTIVDLPRDRVRKVTVTPAAGPAYAIVRASEKEVNFVLEAVPEGRQMASENAANGLGAAAVNVSLDDVRPMAEIDFDGASRVEFETFDGLMVSFEIVTRADTRWARVSAAASAAAKAPAEAEAITRKTRDWAYALPEWKANLLTKPLDSLLKSKPATGKSGPNPK